MLTKRTRQAQKAFESGDLRASRKVHTPAAIRKEPREARGEYIKDIIYGSSDGIITIFSVVAGISGASLSSLVVLVVGFASLFADGLAMAISNYLGTKSEAEYLKKERSRESWELEHYPAGERLELRKILAVKGYRGSDLDSAVRIIASNKEAWIQIMMRDELALSEQIENPRKSAFLTFISFVAAGLIPLMSYVLAFFIPAMKEYSLTLAMALTFASLFAIGACRSIVTLRKWWRSGAEMLVLGGLAAVLAYSIGHFVAVAAGI